MFEAFIFAAPSSTQDGERGQFQSMASNAHDALLVEGFSPTDIVCGWAHFAAVPGWEWQTALAEAWQIAGPVPPPITGLLQPPAAPFCYCSLLVHAIRSGGATKVWHGHTTQPSATTVLRASARHLRLSSVLPRAQLASRASTAELTYDMLAQANHALTARGLSFKDVVRTWLYVRDIRRNYGAVNEGRNRFFGEQQITRFPASTCVEGTFLGADFPVAMDLYAVVCNDLVGVEAIPPGTMGEARVYGSSFARGTRLSEPGRSLVYLSGTASIDAQGAVFAAGDLSGQLDRMFGNVRALLGQVGMDLGQTVSAIAYLKHAKDYGDFVKAASFQGLPTAVPMAVVIADICRPEWLCEIELCAARAI